MKTYISFLLTILFLGGGKLDLTAGILEAATNGLPGLVSGREQSATASPQRDGQCPSMLYVKGNHLVNRAGKLRLKGLMIPDPARLDGEGRFNRDLFESLHRAGANAVRIPVHPQFWLAHPDYVRRYLVPAVGWAGDLGMYAIVDWHSIGNPVTGYAPEVPALFCHTDAMTTNFWRQVASRFKDRPQVVFEVFNEPQNISASAWRRYAGRLVEIIRTAGAEQVCVVGGLEYGRRLDWVLQEPVAGENIAYASHIFPIHAPSGWDRAFGNVAARYPVLITEWGFIAPPQKPGFGNQYLGGAPEGYGQGLMAYLDARRIGWVACWFDDQWQPAMLLPDRIHYTTWGGFADAELKK